MSIVMDITVQKIWIIGELGPDLPDNLFPTHLRILNAFPRAITIVAKHFHGLWRNIGINTIYVASIREQI
jgi:hypothetical protein